MAWFWLTVNMMMLVLAGFAGWRLVKAGRAYFTLFAGLTALLLIVKLFLHLRPELEQNMFRFSSNYIYFAGWDSPLAFLLAVAAAGRFLSPRLRKVAVITLCAVTPVFLWMPMSYCFAQRTDAPAVFDENGICRQQYDSSCGPASAATLLRRLGIQADEKEMVALSLMRSSGVTVLELYRGIDAVLEGTNLQPRIIRSESLDIKPPFLAVVRRPAGEHCVVVLKVESDAVIIGDPARGKFGMTRQDFAAEWTGVALVIEPSAIASN